MKFSSKFVAAACVGVLVLAAEARADQPPPPELTLLSPADGFITNAPTITVTGVAFAAPGAGDVTVTLNSVPVPVNADGSFGGSFALAEWWNPVVLEATDGLGQTTDIYSSVVQDISPPSVWIFGVWDGFYSSAAAVNPVCGAADAYLATWSATLDGQPYNCGDSVTLEGVHTLVVNAVDDADVVRAS